MSAQERDRFERVLFEALQAGFDADAIVVLDEFGSNINLTRQYGCAASGERVYEDVPRTTPPNTTTLAALTTQGIDPAMVFSGSLNRTTFEVYIEHVLGPSLREGQIVVLDNASAHHGGRIAHLIAERGCRLCYLPPYWPDLSPIELAFSKVKACLRRLKARTHAHSKTRLPKHSRPSRWQTPVPFFSLWLSALDDSRSVIMLYAIYCYTTTFNNHLEYSSYFQFVYF